MAVTTPKDSAEQTGDLQQIEENAPDQLETGLPEEEGVPQKTTGFDPKVPAERLGVVVSFSTLAAAVMVGGVFLGIAPRIYAAVAGLMGVAVAVRARRIQNPIMMSVAIAGAIGAIGVLMTVFAGSFSDIIDLGPFVREAVKSGDVQRPPVAFELGWRAILGWLMGGLGFSAAWVAIELRRPSLGMMVPLPIVAFGAISVPKDARILSGLMCLVLFAIGLGTLSGIELDGDTEQRSIAFELRRAARALPLIGAITGALAVLATQTTFLFPPPIFDPTQSAQKPKAIPLSKVPDRVLFTVDSQVTGPWRMGGLDVYEQNAWKLPPFAESRIAEIPETGVIDSEVVAGVVATFEVKGLTGAVLPGLPNLFGIRAEGPALAYDSRTGNIRLSQGTIQEGLKYAVTAARIPTVEELVKVTAPLPEQIGEVDTSSYLELPPPPPAVQALIKEAPKTSKWAELEFVRTKFLDTVVAAGQGTPVDVPPDKVQDMLAGKKEGTPYEIVAGQAMLARWIGVPSRIGYGFDGGDKEAGVYSVRPKHGASFLEVYFPGYKWLPIIGNPTQAKSSFGQQSQQNRNVAASDEIAVQIFVPFETDPRSYLFEQIRAALLVLVPILLFLALIYFTYPGAVKAYKRSKRRTWALRQGPPERIALAYAEWRDLCLDFGYRHESDTPLMFLDRVIPDDEHTEFAWLVTRTLWGDLRPDVTTDDAVTAEELSRSLRKRISQAHSFTLRSIAAISRLSLKNPYAPSLGALTRKEKTRAPQKAA
ncbi:MAG TPA: transglutaminase domain-containing protein [Actinomycetota bacterium]|nr:transglutaminase domain-containing protein [Actinomycetota bacterium]